MTGGAAATPCGAAAGAEWLALTGEPHDEQKRLPTGLVLPQRLHETSSGASLGEKSKLGAGGRERVGELGSAAGAGLMTDTRSKAGGRSFGCSGGEAGGWAGNDRPRGGVGSTTRLARGPKRVPQSWQNFS